MSRSRCSTRPARRALPMATRESPTSSLLELPKVTGVRWGRVGDADERHVIDRVCSNKGSRLHFFVVPLRVTVMEPPLTAAAIT